MARPRTAPAPPPPNGFVASAALLPAAHPGTVSSAADWMEHAWRYHDTVAELRYVANWVGNMMSRAVLVLMKLEGDAHIPITEGPAAQTLEAYFGGRQGQEQMLRATGINLTITGELYHAAVSTPDGGEQWYVLPSGAVQQDRSKKLHARIGSRRLALQQQDMVIRVWTAHPRNADEADSPVRSNLSNLEEVRRTTEHVAAQLDSRLAGAGVLLLPSEIQFAAAPGTDAQANQADAFMQVLGEAMTTPIKDRSSAAAVVPLVVTAPGEHLDKVQHITFWTGLDASVLTMRDNAVRRLAMGMDTPPEVMLGTQDASHWNGWLADEASIKSHLEPRLGVVAHAITTGYLRPALEGVVDDPQQYMVMADTSAIRLRPNRSNEALELYDRGEIGGDPLRRETGFDPNDAPDQQEFARWLLRRVATGSTSPEQTTAALRRLGADLGITAPADSNTAPGDDRRLDTRRRAVDARAPDMERSVQEKQQRDGLVAACEGLVLRALERSGNRLCDARARAEGLGAVDPHERHLHASGNPDKLLDNAWSTAPVVLAGRSERPEAVVAVLDQYVRGLLTSRTPHSRAALVACLARLAEAA